jgi:hypothetical protein
LPENAGMTLEDGVMSFLLSVIGSLLANDLDRECRKKYRCGLFELIYLKTLVNWNSFRPQFLLILNSLKGVIQNTTQRVYFEARSITTVILLRTKLQILLIRSLAEFLKDSSIALSDWTRRSLGPYEFYFSESRLQVGFGAALTIAIALSFLVLLKVNTDRFPEGELLRGMVLDRQGRDLARSIDTQSFWADPREIIDPARTANQLAPLIDANPHTLTARLKQAQSDGRKFAWIARRLD